MQNIHEAIEYFNSKALVAYEVASKGGFLFAEPTVALLKQSSKFIKSQKTNKKGAK